MVPVARALAAIGLLPRLILTGQHPVDPDEHGLVHAGLVHLDCPGGGDPFAHADMVAARAAALLRRDPPALLLVHGDTSSALGGALAAERTGVPLGHVEAGLRSFDRANPWPEEDNRIAIDRRSQLLFAPTETSAANLRAEGLGGAIHITGNTGIDALLDRLPPAAPRRPGRPRLLVTCHRRENWGAPMRDVARALCRLDRMRALEIAVVLHPNPSVAGAMTDLLAIAPGIALVPPLDHGAMLAAIRDSDLVLSDSGGVQEECPALGVPLLVLRERTERPEGVACGSMRLVGTDTRRIVGEVTALLDPAVHTAMAQPCFPFGDGKAGPRIAGHVADFLLAGQARARCA